MKQFVIGGINLPEKFLECIERRLGIMREKGDDRIFILKEMTLCLFMRI